MKHIALAVLVILFLFPVLLLGADFDGDSREDIAIFRPSSGLWAVRGVTRIYFGGTGDQPQPGYYSGGNSIDIAIFRGSTGLWAVRGVTRIYFGGIGDIARPGDYNGDGSADIAIYRESSGFWAVRGITQMYYGQSGDIPIEGGVGQRLYDYVIKSGDGADLMAALASTIYSSVYIPKGSYSVQSDIHVNGVKLITGAGRGNTWILLSEDCNIFLETAGGLTMEKLSVQDGGGGSGQIQVGALAGYTSIINVDAHDSASHGFYGAIGTDYISLLNCKAISPAANGYYQLNVNCGFTSCIAQDCGGVGFHSCANLVNCVADGGGVSSSGFYLSDQLTNCSAFDCINGINNCHKMASCESLSNTSSGFLDCSYIAASYAVSNGINWNNCTHTAACND